MESLVDNRPLLYSLAGAGGFVVMLALGEFHLFPFSPHSDSLTEQIELLSPELEEEAS